MYTDFLYQRMIADGSITDLVSVERIFVNEADTDPNGTYIVIEQDITTMDGRAWETDLRTHSVSFIIYSKAPSEITTVLNAIRLFVYELSGTIESEQETNRVTDYFGFRVSTSLHKEV